MSMVFSFLFPALLAFAGLEALTRRRWPVAVTAALALALCWPLRWCLWSVNLPGCVPLIAWLTTRWWPWQPAERRVACGFAIVSGLLLYPAALGFGPVDPYAWGWLVPAMPLAVAALAAGLIACRNRFGLVLVAALVAFDLGLLESGNLWDYLVDPLFFVAGIVGLAWRR
jgi:hypothetical protein